MTKINRVNFLLRHNAVFSPIPSWHSVSSFHYFLTYKVQIRRRVSYHLTKANLKCGTIINLHCTCKVNSSHHQELFKTGLHRQYVMQTHYHMINWKRWHICTRTTDRDNIDLHSLLKPVRREFQKKLKCDSTPLLHTSHKNMHCCPPTIHPSQTDPVNPAVWHFLPSRSERRKPPLAHTCR